MSHVIVRARFLLALLLVILALNIVGNTTMWSWTLSHYDTVLHVMGGFWITALFFYIIETRFVKDAKARHGFLLLIAGIGMAAVIGIGWEVFEFLFDTFFVGDKILFRTQPSLTDTIIDLVADLVGSSFCLWWYGLSFSRKK